MATTTEHSKKTESAPSFPRDTAVVYDVGEVLFEDTYDEADFTTKGNWFRYVCPLILESSNYQTFAQDHPEQAPHVPETTFSYIHEVADACTAFIVAATKNEKQTAAEKLQTLHQQQLPNSRPQAIHHSYTGALLTQTQLDKHNIIFQQTINTIIDRGVQMALRSSPNPSAVDGALANWYRKLQGLPFTHMDYPPPEPKGEHTPEWNVRNMILDIKGMLKQITYLSSKGTETEFLAAKKNIAKNIGTLRNQLQDPRIPPEKQKTLIKIFNDQLGELIRDPDIKASMKYSGENSKEAIAAREAQAEQALIEKGIDKLLVSTPEYVVYIHRTATTLAENIMETGFATEYNLLGTASPTGDTTQEAFAEFHRRHKFDKAVVILRVPRNLSKQLDKPGVLPVEKTRSGDKTTPVIPPSWIVGYVRREDTTLIKNPHFGDTEYDSKKPPTTYNTRQY